MPAFVMVTRLSPASLRSPHSLEKLEQDAMERIRESCPDVTWRENFAVLGPYDYVDVFDAPDIETAAKVSAMVRSFGHAHTEIWPATEWRDFKMLIRDLPGAED